MKIRMFLILAITVISACSKQQPAAMVPIKATHVATMSEWTEALLSTYKESNVKDEGDGKTSFFAVFPKLSNDRDVPFAFGTRDAFRKVRIYRVGMLVPELDTSLISYVSVSDGGTPFILLSAYWWGRGSWLFMNKVSVMADGEVVLERDFKGEKVKREARDRIVEERYDFVLSDGDIQALRKVNPSSKLLIRFTGDSSYKNVAREGKGIDPVKYFKSDIGTAIGIYDAVNKGVFGHLPPN